MAIALLCSDIHSIDSSKMAGDLMVLMTDPVRMVQTRMVLSREDVNMMWFWQQMAVMAPASCQWWRDEEEEEEEEEVMVVVTMMMMPTKKQMMAFMHLYGPSIPASSRWSRSTTGARDLPCSPRTTRSPPRPAR